MVLTRRAYKSIARWLPNEVISEIIQAAPPHDQASLCRTTTLFQGLGVPLLYRVVDLKTVASVEAFCSTIASHTAKFAKLVRSLTVDAHAFQYIYQLIVPLFECVKVLLDIESLYILGPPAYMQGPAQEWSSLTLPRLLYCTLYTSDRHWTSNEGLGTLSSFLVRHPTLKSVTIRDSAQFEWPSTAARIPLPNLQRICAPAKVFPRIIVDGLKEARLEWEFRDEVHMWPPEPIFLALKATTRRENSFVCSIFCSNFELPSIMASASMHIPHAKALRIVVGDLRSDDAGLRSRDIQCVKKYLSRFTGLEFFSLEILFEQWERVSFGATEADDQLTVHDFGDLCSTLQACRLNQNACRRMNGTWERFPLDDFFPLAGITFVQNN
ncbi:hypothetical protein C8F04DRAFT_1394176 [Mycena alexandri]|uniref:F-box domain-containing protein n=1 Tax=Mycena alexandri TaxID=1745969 RepID=A0AAD6X4R3_9AGAR|nr:hypothetical protein C8F04DRAFT_1394176 [Mycena alexandri]